MALSCYLPSKSAIEASIEVKRAALKAIPADERANSPELEALDIEEKKLERNLFAPFGLSLPEAYFKIDSFACTKMGCVASVNIYANEAARQGDEGILASFTVNFPVPDSMEVNPITYAYEQVKQLPELEGCVDS